MTTVEQNLRPIATTRPKFSWDSGVQWLVVIVTALLVAFPAWPIILQSFMSKPLYEENRAFTFDNYTNLLGNARFWDVLVYTAAFAVATTIIAVIIGIVLAVIINRTNIPLRNLYSNLVTIPYYVSPLVLAFAWMQMYGPQGFGTILVRTLKLPIWQLYSFGGIVIVSAMYYIPYTFLYATSSLALADPQLESAARIGGASPFRTIWSVTIPLLRPAITYSALLTLVSSFELLSIPLVLGNSVGIDTLATYLYVIGVVGVNKDQGAVAAVAVLVVILVTGLVYMQSKLVSLERRFVTVGGKATRPKAIDLGGWKGIVSLFVGLYVLLGIILPLGCIVLTSFVPFLSPFMNPLKMLTLENYQGIFGSPAYRQSVVNSINISIFAAAIGIVFMAVAALIAYRSTFKYRNAVKYMALYPRAFPGIIVGIGFLWAFLLVPGLGSLRNTIIAISIAFIMRYLPLGFSAVSPAVLQVSDELDRAGRVAGATWLGTIRHILLPILKPALVSGYILLAISFLKEYSTALFLVAEGSRVIGTTMLELWKQGGAEPVAALSTIQMAITAVLIIGARKLMGVKLHE
ncbi:MAG: iron ABC transporter permease [Anaerolineales bacterium]|nr:iron ABC transporter permease [Anaerolineales bacterium]